MELSTFNALPDAALGRRGRGGPAPPGRGRAARRRGRCARPRTISTTRWPGTRGSGNGLPGALHASRRPSGTRCGLRRLTEGNRAYEERFGHVYLGCANGRSGADLLATLQERLGNDPVTERGVALGELRRINRLRLEGTFS